jgi:predicted PurR-regulated permease PerM
VAALGVLVPAIGPVAAAVVATTVALFQSPSQAFGVAVVAVAIQMLETYILVPQLMRQAVGLPPLATIFAVLAGFELFGPAGAMMAVPAVAAISILVPEVAAALASTTPLSEPEDQQRPC